MTTFTDLLRQTTTRCNARGKQLAITVLLLGSISLVLWIIAWRVAMVEGLRHMEAFLGPEASARIEMQMQSIGRPDDMQRIGMSIAKAMEERLASIPEAEQKDVLGAVLLRFGADVFPFFFVISVIMCFLFLWSRAFFLLLGAGANMAWWPMAKKSLALIPGLIGVWFVISAITALWIPIVALPAAMILPDLVPLVIFIALVNAAVFWPRLAFAPVILVQDTRSIVDSVRRSFAASKGQWLRIVLNLIGVSAVAWIGTTVAQFILNILIRITVAFSPYAFLLGQIMTFVLLLAAAYRTVFLVELKQAITKERG